MSASIALPLPLSRTLPSRSRGAARLVHDADQQLLVQIQRHNVRALEILYDRYAARALGLAFKILKDRDSAEQVIQDAFWRVWRNAERYEPTRGSFSTWLYAIVHNLAIDQLRRRRNELPLDDPQQAETLEAQLPGADVTETVARHLGASEIRTALKTLPEAQRRVIELAYLEGFSRREIAQQLGEPLGTIHTRARLGLEKLRRLLRLDREAELAPAN